VVIAIDKILTKYFNEKKTTFRHDIIYAKIFRYLLLDMLMVYCSIMTLEIKQQTSNNQQPPNEKLHTNITRYARKTEY